MWHSRLTPSKHAASRRPFPSIFWTCPYSWPSSLKTSSRFCASFSFFPRRRFLPPFPAHRTRGAPETGEEGDRTEGPGTKRTGDHGEEVDGNWRRRRGRRRELETKGLQTKGRRAQSAKECFSSLSLSLSLSPAWPLSRGDVLCCPPCPPIPSLCFCIHVLSLLLLLLPLLFLYPSSFSLPFLALYPSSLSSLSPLSPLPLPPLPPCSLALSLYLLLSLSEHTLVLWHFRRCRSSKSRSHNDAHVARNCTRPLPTLPCAPSPSQRRMLGSHAVGSKFRLQQNAKVFLSVHLLSLS